MITLIRSSQMCMHSVTASQRVLSSQLYSLGIVLYELLAGTLPYNDVSNKDQVGRAIKILSIIIIEHN